jgi:hypothetical protein
MGSIRILNQRGHSATLYDPEVDAEVEDARALFEAEQARGRMLIRTDKEREGEVAKKFDPHGDYTSIPRLAGGS